MVRSKADTSDAPSSSAKVGAAGTDFERLNKLLESRPLLSSEREDDYEHFLVSALITLGVKGDDDDRDIKQMVDCLWRRRRYRQLERVARAAERQEQGLSGLLVELGLDHSNRDCLAHLVNARNAIEAFKEAREIDGKVFGSCP